MEKIVSIFLINGRKYSWYSIRQNLRQNLDALKFFIFLVLNIKTAPSYHTCLTSSPKNSFYGTDMNRNFDRYDMGRNFNNFENRRFEGPCD